MDPKKQGNPKLKEKDFISESQSGWGIPTWLFSAILLGLFGVLWMITSWISQSIGTQTKDKPFLQVTNREMSLFLWQHPEEMRIHMRNKTGYLPGFSSTGNANPKPESIGEYVSAPPALLFQYHTWKRLLGDYLFPRPISSAEFKEFLAASPEWNAANWTGASEGYKHLLESLDKENTPHLESSLPKEVQQAFIGWKNYYKEGGEINAERPTVGAMRTFLQKYPHYERACWRNIYPSYLKILLDEKADPQALIPIEQMEGFLRSAYFNDTHLAVTMI